MTKRADPPRLCPTRSLPPYAYRPGRDPHPTRDPAGHRHGAPERNVAPPQPAEWQECEDYLYGLDLFNRGYYWEAHEAWEGLWRASPADGPAPSFFKALIALAAAGQKWALDNPRGAGRHAGRASALFAEAGSAAGPRFMGFDLEELREKACRMKKAPPDFVLLPAKN